MECCTSANYATSYLPLVQLLWCGWPQANQSVIFDDCAGALPWRCKALHLSHIIQALFNIAKVSRLRWALIIRVRVSSIFSILIFTGNSTKVTLQTPTLLCQLYFTLQDRGQGRHEDYKGSSDKIHKTIKAERLQTWYLKYSLGIWLINHSWQHYFYYFCKIKVHLSIWSLCLVQSLPRITFWC